MYRSLIAATHSRSAAIRDASGLGRHSRSAVSSHSSSDTVVRGIMRDTAGSGATAAFCLTYLTFFLDNVLLTVLVPIVPDWVSGSSLELWARAGAGAPLVALLNDTVHRGEGTLHDGSGLGGAQAGVGAVLGAKAAAQLLVAPLAARLCCRRGPARVLRASTALLASAALLFSGCSRLPAGRAACAGAGRALHGAGAALANVSGIALVSRALSRHAADRAIAALLGAVALGVLVGYPFGGAAIAMWSRATPFLLIALALLANLALQYVYLDREEYNREEAAGGAWGWAGVRREARRGAARAGAGAVLVTTSAMAALEPCLPLWIMHKFRPRRWQTGAAFVPDSAGYLATTTALGGVVRRLGAERVALVGVAAVGLAALGVPHAGGVWALALPQTALGAGLGAADAALVPALVARARRRRVAHVAALLQAASSAAYALGPVLGGVMSWAVGFETTLRALGVLNLLYAALLYRALCANPLSEQWGASTSPAESDSDEEEEEEGEPLQLTTTLPTPMPAPAR